jgi:hypothetical protein
MFVLFIVYYIYDHYRVIMQYIGIHLFSDLTDIINLGLLVDLLRQHNKFNIKV